MYAAHPERLLIRYAMEYRLPVVGQFDVTRYPREHRSQTDLLSGFRTRVAADEGFSAAVRLLSGRLPPLPPFPIPVPGC